MVVLTKARCWKGGVKPFCLALQTFSKRQTKDKSTGSQRDIVAPRQHTSPLSLVGLRTASPKWHRRQRYVFPTPAAAQQARTTLHAMCLPLPAGPWSPRAFFDATAHASRCILRAARCHNHQRCLLFCLFAFVSRYDPPPPSLSTLVPHAASTSLGIKAASRALHR